MAVTIIKQPSSVTAIVGTTAKFAVVADGNINGYNWQIRKPTDTSWAGTTMTGSKTPVLEVPAAESRNGYMYRCIIYDTDGNSVISDVVTLTVIDVGFINRSTLTAIADAIRAKTETTDTILPADMAGLIEGITVDAGIMSGTFSTSDKSNSAALGVTLPESDNYLFFCTDTATMSQYPNSPHPIHCIMHVNLDGVGYSVAWVVKDSSTANPTYATGGLVSFSGDTVVTLNGYDFYGNRTYDWWYAYV